MGDSLSLMFRALIITTNKKCDRLGRQQNNANNDNQTSKHISI